MSRSKLITLHAALAGFFLPVGVMFFITGALYTWGQKGSYQTTTVEIPLSAPLNKEDQAGMVALVNTQLEQREIAPPSGKPKVKSAGTSFYLEWTGSNRDVQLAPTSDPAVGSLKIKDTTLYRRMVQLHKAKGGQAFKVVAALLTVGLLMLFASGFRLALAAPATKRATLAGLGAGSLLFILAILLS